MKNFIEMTVASQAEACSTGAQNMEASEKMTASRGSVTRAESSLRTNIARSSYSNSGLRSVPWVRRARSSRTCSCVAARGSLARARGSRLAVVSSPRIVSLARCRWAQYPLPALNCERWQTVNLAGNP